MNKSISKAWRQYEAGKEYKRRIGLYETVRRNERFYRGDQWYGAAGGDLPRPVFNLLRRIVDYLICTVASGNITVGYDDESLPYITDPQRAEAVKRAVALLAASTAYRWERSHMDSKVYTMLTDAALSGDGVICCWWDPSVTTGQDFGGDIALQVIDNVNLFAADVNRADIQSQDYIIIAGRDSVASLRDEARRAGAGGDVISKIRPDSETAAQSGDMAAVELDGEDEEKATFIIKFWREDGHVVFEKSVRDAVIRRQHTPQRLYPVAYFNWYPTKNSFHGTSPVTGLIPNQKFINRAFAMVMKHMTDTAFSKIVYDKTKIPEWSNEVGEAIAAVGGTNVADAVSVVGVGEMQDGYLELIKLAVEMTKEVMGATESALGDGDATNTSAILALQEAARTPLEQIRRGYYQCIEDLANIWADMVCAYYPDGRLLPYLEDGRERSSPIDAELLKNAVLRARVEVGEITRYSASGSMTMLNRLLDGGYITPAQYIERLPSGMLNDRAGLLAELNGKGSVSADE